MIASKNRGSRPEHVKENGKISDERRKEGRVRTQIYVRLITRGHRGAILSEDTVTEDISGGGACVLSDLPVEAGRYVQLIRINHTRSYVATVRARSLGPDRKVRLHLQFVNQKWPLRGDPSGVRRV